MKLHKFLKTVPLKLYLILLGLVLFSFFSNDFGLVDIQKTAVILAAGIDKAEDGEGYALTTQIAVPKGNDRTQGGTSSVEVTAEGNTVSDCISEIFAKTGWVPKVVFCNLIILSEEAAKEDTISELNYFLRNEYMNDSCFLAVCEGKAQELLSTKSATDDTSSFAIVKLFSDAAEKSGKVMPNTLKDFAVGYYSVSKSSYMPFLRPEEQKTSSKQEEGSESEQGGQSSESEKIYRAEETAIFSEGKMVSVLPPEQTLAFSLLKGNVETGTFGTKEDNKPITLTVLKNKGDVKLNMKSAPKANLTLNVMVRLCCRGTTAPIEDISSDEVDPKILESAKQTLDEYVRALWNTITDANCDLFNLKRELYRSSAKKYRVWKDFFPTAITPSFETKVTSQK